MQQDALVRLKLDPAGVEQGSARAASSLDRMSSSGQSSARALASALRGPTTLLAAFNAALGVGTLSAWAGQTIAAADALVKMRRETRTSVETLSGLQDVATVSGNRLQDLAGILARTNTLLREPPDPRTAGILASIGVGLEQLRKLDAGEALHVIARGFSRFADDGARAQRIAALFGDDAQKLTVFLDQLGRTSELQGRATTRQAEQYENLRRQMAQLEVQATNAARSGMANLLPYLTDAAGALANASREGRTWVDLLRAMDRVGPIGTRGLAERLFGGATQFRGAGASGDFSPSIADAPAPFVPGQGVNPPGVASGVAAAIRARDRSSRPRVDAFNRAQDELEERIRKGGQALEESEVAALERMRDQRLAFLADLREQTSSASLGLFKDERERADALVKLDRETAERRLVALGFKDEQLADARAMLDNVMAMRFKANELASQRMAQDAAGELRGEVSDALAAAFRDTKNPIRAFAEALGNTVYTRLSARLADALATSLVGSDGSGGLLGQFLGAVGGVSGGGVAAPGYTSGGIVGGAILPGVLRGGMASGTNYVPRDMFALLHRGEAIVPQRYNPAAGGSAATVVIHSPVSVAPGVSPAEFQAMLDVRDRALKASLAQDFARGGVLSRLVNG